MAKLAVDRYIKRSGSQFLRMEHYEVADMFGRRRRPRLSLSYRIVERVRGGAGTIQYAIILGIENSGRGPAKAPFLKITLPAPLRFDEYGVDGNRHEGLPRVLVARHPSQEASFGGSAIDVVHPGTVRDVAAVRGELRRDQDRVEDWVVQYDIAAEDIRLRSDVLRVSGDEVIRALRP
jgi:hypothetical protein